MPPLLPEPTLACIAESCICKHLNGIFHHSRLSCAVAPGADHMPLASVCKRTPWLKTIHMGFELLVVCCACPQGPQAPATCIPWKTHTHTHTHTHIHTQVPRHLRPVFLENTTEASSKANTYNLCFLAHAIEANSKATFTTCTFLQHYRSQFKGNIHNLCFSATPQKPVQRQMLTTYAFWHTP